MVDRGELDDAVLVTRVRRGDERSVDILLGRYRHFARSKARSYFVSGSDKQDVIQEGMIGLFKAIRDFDIDEPTPFRAFADLCISRQILTAIKSANRNKHLALNHSASLDAPLATAENLSGSLGDRLVESSATNPEELLIRAEELKALHGTIDRNLTRMERKVLGLYLQGKSYEEIACILQNHVKSIDNALQRVKRKMQQYIDQRNREALSFV